MHMYFRMTFGCAYWSRYPKKRKGNAYFLSLQKLQKEAEDSYLDSGWADNSALKKSFHGIKDIKWGPR